MLFILALCRRADEGAGVGRKNWGVGEGCGRAYNIYVFVYIFSFHDRMSNAASMNHRVLHVRITRDSFVCEYRVLFGSITIKHVAQINQTTRGRFDRR